MCMFIFYYQCGNNYLSESSVRDWVHTCGQWYNRGIKLCVWPLWYDDELWWCFHCEWDVIVSSVEYFTWISVTEKERPLVIHGNIIILKCQHHTREATQLLTETVQCKFICFTEGIILYLEGIRMLPIPPSTTTKDLYNKVFVIHRIALLNLPGFRFISKQG